MPMAVYGHAGVPLLVFPTATSDFEEFERMGMVEALAGPLAEGLIRLYCIDSINGQSWSHPDLPLPEKVRRQALYDAYVSQEVVPVIWHDQGRQVAIATTGASFGAYHAANTLLKHPEYFRWCICLSGVYDMRPEEGDEPSEPAYRDNNPAYYLPRLRPHQRARLQRCSIELICGRGAWERVHWSRDFSRLLWTCGIPHHFDLWGSQSAHDWPWWHRQLSGAVRRLFG